MATEAVQLILRHVRTEDFILVASPVHDIEIDAIPDLIERGHLQSTLRRIAHRIKVDVDLAR